MNIEMKFTLPEEDSEFEAATNGRNLANILYDYKSWLRSQQKHHNREVIEIDELRDKLSEMISDAGMSWDCVIWQ